MVLGVGEGGEGQGTKEERDGKGRKGGHTMTSPPSYATMSWSSVASPQHWGQHKVVRMEVGEVCGASGCWKWNSLTTAGAWTSVWGSHMLPKFDQPTNLTRYHNFPHLNPESRIPSTLYSSCLSMVIGPGCGGHRHSAISSRM